ncbi:MAG: hypothetical protein R3Y12_08025 [Clostridia bacterium]
MSISLISSYYNTSSLSSTTSTTATSTAALLESLSTSTTETSSYGMTQDSVSISSAGRQAMQPPPDFDSMSTEEFAAHLTEMQATLAENGITSDFDVSSMTDDELNSLKSEMASKGKNGPPPPPPPSSSSSTSSTDDLLASLLESLQEDSSSTETTYSTVDEMLELYKNFI